jgi:hypothetical protein
MSSIHSLRSEARARLAELLDAQNELNATLEITRGAMERLRETMSAADPVAQQIAHLDAIETNEALEAARASIDPPAPDAKRRESLNRELETAKVRASAAARAMPSIEAEFTREAGKLPFIAAAINGVLAEIVAEESNDLFDDYDTASRELAAKADRISQAREMILRLFEASGKPHEAAVAQQNFLGKLEKAMSRPPIDLDAASQSRMSWLGLEAALRSDANARLNDAD